MSDSTFHYWDKYAVFIDKPSSIVVIESNSRNAGGYWSSSSKFSQNRATWKNGSWSTLVKSSDTHALFVIDLDGKVVMNGAIGDGEAEGVFLSVKNSHQVPRRLFNADNVSALDALGL